MLSDEQLAERLRSTLAHETAHIEPQPGLLDAVHAEVWATPSRNWRLALAGATGLLVAACVALAAILLIGDRHRSSPPVLTQPVGRSPTPTTRTLGPAPVRRSAVAAPVQVKIGAVAHYCSGPDGTLIACRASQRPVMPMPQRLVQVRVLARLASGRNSWYAWNLAAPPSCPQADDGGPTRGPVRAGSTLLFDTLVPPNCRGTIRALVVYVTQAPSADRERTVIVGRTTATLP